MAEYQLSFDGFVRLFFAMAIIICGDTLLWVLGHGKVAASEQADKFARASKKK